MKRFFLLIFFAFACLLIYQYYPYTPISDNVSIDKIMVEKSKRKLTVYADGSVIKTYSIALGDQPVGHKQREGDEKTPEGVYFINAKAGKGASGFHKNLGISYPSPKDKLSARQKGFSPGGDIKIHGLKNGLGFIGRLQSWRDWTNGCIAVTNEEMDDLYQHIKIGTSIIIKP